MVISCCASFTSVSSSLLYSDRFNLLTLNESFADSHDAIVVVINRRRGWGNWAVGAHLEVSISEFLLHELIALTFNCWMSWTLINWFSQQVVRRLLKKDCQCHGISGSCQMKTCWNTLPQFREIGDVLFKKYERAKLVEAQKKDTGISLVIKRQVRINFIHQCDFCNAEGCILDGVEESQLNQRIWN